MQCRCLKNKICLKEAVSALENTDYAAAESLLRKAVPLRQKRMNAAEQLLGVCRRAMLSEKINDYISKAKLYKSMNQTAKTYQFYLNAFDLSYDNDEIIKVLEETHQTAINESAAEIKNIRDDYVKRVIDRIDSAIVKKDFSSAGQELQKLKILIPESDLIAAHERKITENKSTSLKEYLDKSREYQNQDKLDKAYECLALAQNIEPDDTAIIEQKRILQEDYLFRKQFKIQDKIYCDKAYYLSATNAAAGEKSFAVHLYNELRNINPVYEWLPKLKEALVWENLIEN